MNNAKYYNASLAYDFSMFMPKEEKTTENVVKMPKPVSKSNGRAAIKRVSVSAFTVMTVCFIMAALFGNIFLRLRINEVNSEISDIKEEISTLESERTSLQVELERRISFSNVEVEAAEMGMQKMSKDQVKYIRVNNKNTAVMKNGEVVTESE